MASTSTPSLTHIYGDKMTTLLLSDDIAALKAEIIKHTAVAQILVKRGNIYHIVGAYCLHDFGGDAYILKRRASCQYTYR